MASGGPPAGADIWQAAKSGDTARVTALLDGGVPVDSRNKDGWTPLMKAADCGHTATVEALLSNKARVNLQAKNGETALHWAAVNEHTAVVEILVAAGANMNIKTKDGMTPIMTAAAYGHTASVQSLVAATADMNIQDKDGWTALIWALKDGEFEDAEVLIRAGAGLGQQEEATGWTALFHAVEKGHFPMVRLLLERGADPTHKDKEGKTPFDIAKKNGYNSVMEELKEFLARQPVVIQFKNLDFKEIVGEGAFGAVFKGYWKSSGRGRQLVAIKQLGKVVEKEIKILGSVRHPNIITLYGTSEKKPCTYLVTDFAENGSLFDFISKRPSSPDLKRALPWAKQVAEGMLYLHNRGIIHRDLKSCNVVLTSEWVAKICDLGTARELDHTTMMTSVGTVAWMAPEMLKEERASKKCDVYSYGIVLWELVTFQVPFEGLARFPVMMKVTSGERPAIPSDCDQSLSDLIQRCWVDNYKERPSFDEILKTLKLIT